MTPPKVTPPAAPTAPIALHTPNARRLAAGSVNRAASSASSAGIRIAAPTPCSARAAISAPPVLVSPASSDAPVNVARPTRNISRLPSRSVARPAPSWNPPKVTWYAVLTQPTATRPSPSALPMVGSARLMIETSRKTTSSTLVSRISTPRRPASTPDTRSSLRCGSADQ